MAWVVQWYWKNKKNEPPASRCKLALVVFNPGPVVAASERCFRPYISVSASCRGEKVVPFCFHLLALRTVINKSPTCEGQTHIPCSASVISCKLSCYEKKIPETSGQCQMECHNSSFANWNLIWLLFFRFHFCCVPVGSEMSHSTTTTMTFRWGVDSNAI